MLDLTPERQKTIDDAYLEWRDVGLSTDPADFNTAEQAISNLYASIGKDKPHFVRLSSPFAAEIYINLLCKTWPTDYTADQLWGQLGDQLWGQLGDQLWGQLRDQLGDQLRGQLWGQLRDQLGDQLRGQLGDQLGDQLRGQLGDQLWGQLRDQLGDQLRGQLGDQLWGQLRDQLGDQLWGQLGDQLRGQLGDSKLSFTGTWFEGSWDSYIWGWGDAGRRLGAKYPNELDVALDQHCAISKSIGWFYPFNDFCILTDRPEIINFDDQERLHSEIGPSLRYRDGYNLYAWHGTAVPSEWIENKESVDPASVLKTDNVEQRAAGAAIIGWAKMLDVLDAKIIDSDPDPDHGDLIELTLPGLPEPGLFLRAYCKRNGLIVEGVPRTSDIDGKPIKTVKAAQAWSFGKPESDFQYPDLVS